MNEKVKPPKVEVWIKLELPVWESKGEGGRRERGSESRAKWVRIFEKERASRS